MRIKRVKIGIKSTKEVLEKFVKTAEALERGEKVKKEAGIYFEDTRAFRKFMTPRRLELLHLIKKHHPKTLGELSRLAERDLKNVAQDLKILENLGLVNVKKEKGGKKEVSPSVDYDTIELMIAV